MEVCLNETWGKICDYISIYGWNRTEAEVVCKQLGYTGASEEKICTCIILLYLNFYDIINLYSDSSTHNFGAGSVPVTIKNARCRETESSLAECVYTISHNVCSRDEHGIVGVQCIQGKCHTWESSVCTKQTLIGATQTDTVKSGELRLTDGLTRYEGRVEMYWNSEWRTLCNDGWDESDAKVVCRQLNYLSTTIEVKGIIYIAHMQFK